MTKKFLSIVPLLILLISCTGYEDHQLTVEKIRESVNAVKFTVDLTGGGTLQCEGTIKYKEILLHRFTIESNQTETPSEFLINFSEFPELTQQLAVDFVLKRKPALQITISNTREDFIRTEMMELDPVIPPIMTGIEVESKDLTRKYPIGFSSEKYEVDSYLIENGIVTY